MSRSTGLRALREGRPRRILHLAFWALRTIILPMKTVTLSAVFDGKHIRLEEPYAIPPQSRLLVTVLPPESEADRAALLRLAAHGLARAYSETEPDYSNRAVEEPNARYEVR